MPKNKFLLLLHDYIIPLLYVVIWSAGILTIGKAIILALDLGYSDIKDFYAKCLVGELFVGALSIYTLFICELLLLILDTKIVYWDYQYGKTLKKICIISAIFAVITFSLCGVYLFLYIESVALFWIIFCFMIGLKLLSVLFNQRSSFGNVPIHSKVLVTKLKNVNQ